MLRITFVSGNIFRDHIHDDIYAETEYEHLRITRHDAEKSRLRKSTDRGTDIGLVLEQGTRLRHGDILQGDEKTIVVEQIPEKVATLKLDKSDTESLILAGHIIGNRHRPVSIKDNTIHFPIQADSEIEVFEKLLSGINTKITIEEIIFTPHDMAWVSGHG